ncbi:PREDICTED: obscurin-like protein 1 [Thamnophis sirtalis]|uniref:Obscurin-like protein 1 n=1 Tax=Thamnophis sirtalis TaxID=35019 RepID=A0A6I9XWI5_9SAUR|nr:PREDICTED: obscurin-like protein 1 [Thamnophis sirtalis]
MDAFGGAPRFLASPRTFSVQSGTNAILKWQVAGEPRPSIVWEKDGSVLELPSGRMFLEVNGDAYSLLVSQAGPGDSGRYVCKAKNSVGETYAAALLKVETGSELKPNGDLDCQPPTFLNRPVSACVTRGEDVTFACRVSGQLEWKKDGRRLSDIFESSHYRMDVEPGDWHSLHIYNTRLPDAGVYVCRAQNSFGESMAAAVLLVDPVACLPHNDPSQGALQNSHFKKPPESQEDKRHPHHPARIVLSEGRQNGEVLPSSPPTKSFTVNEGKHAKFRCYVIGKPKPEIVWQKDGKVLSPGRRHLLYEDREGYFILKVLYCTARDCGLYVCTACNTAGQTLSAVRLHVQEPQLQFQAPLMDVEVMEHQDAVLECQVPLETMPTTWYLEDKRLQPSPKYLMEEQGLLRRLTVRDARADDDGIYLCEMEGKGRSIGELSVQGLIVKRLPRKLDVMEGENAAFYVETREPVEAPSWGRNGQELVEAPHTLIRSFGKTHILVLVHVSRHDAGVITFMAGDSQTSAQLRVKCAKRIPPSAPVEVKMCTRHSNAALLAWCPPPNLHRSPPSSYILERQTVGEAEWVPCLTTDVASMVEVPGDGVPQEADYRFRVCSANQYGCSEHVEFPGSVHLVPRAHIKEGLQDVTVCINEDATFSVKLSAPMSGCWYLSGKRLAKEEEDQQYLIMHSGVSHTLQVKNVQLAANGSEVRFEANGVKESAVLHVQETPVHIMHCSPEEAHTYLVSERVVLACELSRPNAPVCWYKDGEKVEESQDLLLENEGPHCRLILVSAHIQDTGEFVCDAGGDSAFFNITITEPPVQVVCSNADEAHTYWALEQVTLACELSRPNALVHWYKDGKAVEETEGLRLESEGPHHRLIIASAQVQDTGEFVCDLGGDSVFFTVTVSDHPVRIIYSNDEESHVYQVAERIELSCELSRPDALVHWYKDGEEVEESEGLLLESEGPHRRLVIPSAQVKDSGEFVCDAGGDSAFFNITVKEPLVQIVQSNAEATHAYQTSDRVVLTCELSCPNAPVQWYKDGEELEEGDGLLFESQGPHRRLVLPFAQVQDTGEFVCDAGDDSAFFNVTVAEPLVQILQPVERSLEKQVQEFDRLELSCTVSIPDAPVRWFKDGLEVDETHNLLLHAEGAERCLMILRTSVEDAGEYICETKDESVSFDVMVSESPVKIVQPRRTPSVLKASTGDTVALACVLSHGNAPVHWVKDGVRVEANSGLILEEEGARRCLVIPAAGPEHSGKYICHTLDDTMTFTLQVSDPPVQIVGRDELQTHHHCLVSEDLVLSITLSCPKGEVKWYKDGEKLQDTERMWLEQDGTRHSLVISAVEMSDAGEYLCDSGDDSLIFYVMIEVPRLVEIISELHNLTVLEGDDAIFKVVICPDDVRLNWQLNGQDVVNSERLTITKNGLCHTLTLRQCRLSDTGIVTVCAEGLSSSGRLSVQEAQVLFVRTLRDLAAEEGQDVRLEVELSVESAEVQWMKQGILLQQNPRLSMEVQGPKRVLTIHQIELADRGTYRCESLHDRTQARLSVEPRKVTVKKPLSDVETLEKETVTFELELSHPNVLGVWTRDGIRVKPSSTCQMSATGCVHSLTLQRLMLDDTGTVAFTADTVRSCARLTVREPPITMLRLPQDLGIPETGSATFECELSRPLAEVKWYKDGKEIQVSPNCRIYSVGRRRLLQLNHCSLEDAGEYMCDAGDCHASAKLRIFERQVQIVRELEDVRVQENENAVFICEVSLAEVKGEWYNNGERLKVTSTVKIRQEGTRHFLLLSSARPEDTGQVRFVAKTAASEARLEVEALPIRIVKPLRDKTVLVRHKATLECTVSQARGRVRWFRGDTEIYAGPKYEICNLDCYRTLVIHCVEPADEGLYTCDALDDHSTARLLVEAEGIQVVQPLKNVEVMAPFEAQFECEISAPSDFTPQWSLNGEELQPGLQVQMESVGHIHKLRFCRTSPNMSGMVKITIGNARSKAHLTVRGKYV